MRPLRSAAALCLLGGITAPAGAAPQPVKAAVLRSTGTLYLNQTIWRELNSGWSQFGETPVQIDYTSLAGYGLTLDRIAATQVDVLIFSTPGYLRHTDKEINAIIQYVVAGHGLIITYDDFLWNRKALAPLVGLSTDLLLGTGTWDPFSFELLVPGHPLFARVAKPYATGVPFMIFPQMQSGGWRIGTGQVLARATPHSHQFTSEGIIVANDAGAYRGVYFAHYIEDKSEGANQQDMQVFYNALVWAGTPEPGSGLLLLAGCGVLIARRRRRWSA